jgi:Zn-dependent M16 (insulinase) family peptidase|tara:strand:+ start:3705 stop:4016 length:312 start_codon:yes stop_codon:yes gene_type:complete
MKEKIEYKFNEEDVLQYLKQYIDKTYEQHYANGNIQATEIIFDAEHGIGFCIGNIIKYAQRYGKKDGHNPADLLKIIHYAIMLYGKKHMVVLDGEDYGTHQRD